MIEIRAAELLPCQPISARRSAANLADVSLRPLIRGLLFLAALSLPVLGCVVADRFHGNASGTTQVAAAPHIPPHRGVAASSSKTTSLRLAEASVAGGAIER